MLSNKATSWQPCLRRHIAEPVLAPRHASLRKRPRLLAQILARGASRDIDGHEMVHPRMRLPRVRALGNSGHASLPLGRRRLNGLLQRLVKRHGVRQRGGLAPRLAQVPQIMDRHARADDDDVLVAQRGDGLAQAVVGIRVLIVEQADLHERHAEGVLLGVDGDVEAREDAVVQAPLQPGGLDACVAEQAGDPGRELRAALARVLGLVVFGGEVVEAL